MEIIEIEETDTNINCLEIWSFIKNKKPASVGEVVAAFIDSKINTDYCLKRLKRIGAIGIEQGRKSNGDYDNAELFILREPLIKHKANLCSNCGIEFKKKNSDAKYKDLCHKCTEEKYMKPREFKCVYCNEIGFRKDVRTHMGNIYHKECYVKYCESVAPKKIVGTDRYCPTCGEVKLTHRRRFCDSCLSKAHNPDRICPNCNVNKLEYRRRYCSECVMLKDKVAATKHENKKSTTTIKSIRRKCSFCGINEIKYKGDRCASLECRIKSFACVDSQFSSNNSKSEWYILKKRIIGENCCVCGYNKVVQYHHVIFKENGGLDRMGNLIPLCPNHHQEVHLCGLDVSEHHKLVLQRLEDIKNGLIDISDNF